MILLACDKRIASPTKTAGSTPESFMSLKTDSLKSGGCSPITQDYEKIVEQLIATNIEIFKEGVLALAGSRLVGNRKGLCPARSHWIRHLRTAFHLVLLKPEGAMRCQR